MASLRAPKDEREKDFVKDIIRSEPERITYENAIKDHPHFARIFMDGQKTDFARCQACSQLYVIKVTVKSGLGPCKDHTRRMHPDFDDDEYKPNCNRPFRNVSKREVHVSSSEEDSDGGGSSTRRSQSGDVKSKYPARPEAEIVAALEEIAAKEAEEPKPLEPGKQKENPTWNYFKKQGENESGNAVFACVFCTFTGTKNVSVFKGHILYSCAGCPQEIRDSFKATLGASKLAYNYVTTYTSKKKNKYERRGRPPKYPRHDDESTRDFDSDTADNFREALQDEDGNLETDQIVTILSKLLGTQPAAATTTEQQPSTSQNGLDEDGKKPLAKFTEADFDREIKELTVRKMRAELKEIQERTMNTKIIRHESEERTRLYKKINQDFDQLIKFINMVVNAGGDERRQIIGSLVGSVSNGLGSSIPNILEEAFAETINGS